MELTNQKTKLKLIARHCKSPTWPIYVGPHVARLHFQPIDFPRQFVDVQSTSVLHHHGRQQRSGRNHEPILLLFDDEVSQVPDEHLFLRSEVIDVPVVDGKTKEKVCLL